MVPRRLYTEASFKYGLLLKCPLCNNSTIFEEATLDFGIYIPEQMLHGSEGTMLSKSCCIGIIAVTQSIVSAEGDILMQRLQHDGKLFCVGTVAPRAFTLDVET
jgi:hypothetical protein